VCWVCVVHACACARWVCVGEKSLVIRIPAAAAVLDGAAVPVPHTVCGGAAAACGRVPVAAASRHRPGSAVLVPVGVGERRVMLRSERAEHARRAVLSAHAAADAQPVDSIVTAAVVVSQLLLELLPAVARFGRRHPRLPARARSQRPRARAVPWRRWLRSGRQPESCRARAPSCVAVSCAFSQPSLPERKAKRRRGGRRGCERKPRCNGDGRAALARLTGSTTGRCTESTRATRVLHYSAHKHTPWLAIPRSTPTFVQEASTGTRCATSCQRGYGRRPPCQETPRQRCREHWTYTTTAWAQSVALRVTASRAAPQSDPSGVTVAPWMPNRTTSSACNSCSAMNSRDAAPRTSCAAPTATHTHASTIIATETANMAKLHKSGAHGRGHAHATARARTQTKAHLLHRA
jgi:hypothetical protein